MASSLKNSSQSNKHQNTKKENNNRVPKNSSSLDQSFDLLIDLMPEGELKDEMVKSKNQGEIFADFISSVRETYDEKKLTELKARIAKENEAFPERLNALKSLNKYCSVMSVNKYLDSMFPIPDEPNVADYYNQYGYNPKRKYIFLKKQYEAKKKSAETNFNIAYSSFTKKSADVTEQRSSTYKSIIEGGESFLDYIEYNVRLNRKKALQKCNQEFDIPLVISPNSTSNMEIQIGLPSYEDFKPIKEIHYDENNSSETIEYLREHERRMIYEKFVYSVMLQTIAIIYNCADNINGLGYGYPIDILTAYGYKGFFDDSYGKNKYAPIIVVPITKEQYHEINPQYADPEKVFRRLNSEIYENLFFIDYYDPEALKTVFDQRKIEDSRSRKKEESEAPPVG